jgi:pyruvate dehydrogenase E1 component alpha subunit
MEKSEFLDLYRQMVVIRRLEERAAELYQQGKIGGFLHLYIGQEAVSTGLIAARLPVDRVITAYRDHGVAINCGISAREVIAELLGKATGCSGGKGGSMQEFLGWACHCWRSPAACHRSCAWRCLRWQ